MGRCIQRITAGFSVSDVRPVWGGACGAGEEDQWNKLLITVILCFVLVLAAKFCLPLKVSRTANCCWQYEGGETEGCSYICGQRARRGGHSGSSWRLPGWWWRIKMMLFPSLFPTVLLSLAPKFVLAFTNLLSVPSNIGRVLQTWSAQTNVCGCSLCICAYICTSWCLVVFVALAKAVVRV